MVENVLKSDISATDKVYGLSLFWREVSYNFAFFDQLPDLDWEKAYREYIPRVLATNSVYHYYQELLRFCALLKDGHTNVYLPPEIQKSIGRPPVVTRAIQRRAFITDVSKKLSPRCPIGAEIIAVDDTPLSEYLLSEVFPYISSSTEHILWDWGIGSMLDGFIDTVVRVTIRTPEDRITNLALVRQGASEEIDWLMGRRRKREIVEFRQLNDKMVYVAINSFQDDLVVQEFEDILPRLYASRGLIIDLRHNTGGNSELGHLSGMSESVIIG